MKSSSTLQKRKGRPSSDWPSAVDARIKELAILVKASVPRGKYTFSDVALALKTEFPESGRDYTEFTIKNRWRSFNKYQARTQRNMGIQNGVGVNTGVAASVDIHQQAGVLFQHHRSDNKEAFGQPLPQQLINYSESNTITQSPGTPQQPTDNNYPPQFLNSQQPSLPHLGNGCFTLKKPHIWKEDELQILMEEVEKKENDPSYTWQQMTDTMNSRVPGLRRSNGDTTPAAAFTMRMVKHKGTQVREKVNSKEGEKKINGAEKVEYSSGNQIFAATFSPQLAHFGLPNVAISQQEPAQLTPNMGFESSFPDHGFEQFVSPTAPEYTRHHYHPQLLNLNPPAAFTHENSNEEFDAFAGAQHPDFLSHKSDMDPGAAQYQIGNDLNQETEFSSPEFVIENKSTQPYQSMVNRGFEHQTGGSDTQNPSSVFGHLGFNLFPPQVAQPSFDEDEAPKLHQDFGSNLNTFNTSNGYHEQYGTSQSLQPALNNAMITDNYTGNSTIQARRSANILPEQADHRIISNNRASNYDSHGPYWTDLGRAQQDNPNSRQTRGIRPPSDPFPAPSYHRAESDADDY